MSIKKIIKDGHVHSPYCPHGSKDSFELYIEAAINLGLKEITFAEHMTLPQNFLPPELMASSAPTIHELNSYIKDLKSLKSKYIGKIVINIGFEVDYIEGYEEKTTELLNNNGADLDEIILSVHYIKVEDDYYRVDLNSTEFNQLILKLGSLEKVYDKYYETVLKSIQCNLGNLKPTRIGHPSLVRTFRTDYPLTYTNTFILEQIAKDMKKRNYELDFNTSGLRKPCCKEFYPSGTLYELLKYYNVPMIFGSDAHNSLDVGKNFFII
jgi:histidinol-phosphatase (PHP family)